MHAAVTSRKDDLPNVQETGEDDVERLTQQNLKGSKGSSRAWVLGLETQITSPSVTNVIKGE